MFNCDVKFDYGDMPYCVTPLHINIDPGENTNSVINSRLLIKTVK